MNDDALGREILSGVEDGGPKGNWREPSTNETQQSATNDRSSSGKLAKDQGAFGKTGTHDVEDSREPKTHKGEDPSAPRIGDVYRARENDV